jgi:hypothetical protein
MKRRELHGLSKHPMYHSWIAMIRRCHASSEPGYKNYGARGIKVCDRWRNSFVAFLADMGGRPSPKHTLDRINNDGNYEPGNCRWATRHEQRVNSRNPKRGGKPLLDMAGKRFSKLTVLEFSHSSGSGGVYWVCRCDCGVITFVSRGNLTSGVVASCGCFSRSAKLKPEQVLKIRRSAETNVSLAKKHRVNPTTIRDIKLGRSWKHI